MTHARQDVGSIFSPTSTEQPLERASMTLSTDKSASSSHGPCLEVGDWNVMFCAVLARLGAAIEPLDLKSPQWSVLPECVDALQMLRQSALQLWGRQEHNHALNHSLINDVLAAMGDPKAQTAGNAGPGPQA